MSKGSLGLLSAYWPENTPRYAYVPLKTVADVTLRATAEKAADRTALESSAGPLSYGELLERVARLAAALRGRCSPAARLAISLEDPADLAVAALGAFEAGMLALLSAGPQADDLLARFAPELVVGSAGGGALPVVSVAELLRGTGAERTGNPDFRAPVLALPLPGGGEGLHNPRSLVATAIAVGAFYMLAEDSNVALLEPPTQWHSLALLLAAWHCGSTVWAGWGASPAPLPAHVDYVLCSWERASRMLEAGSGARPGVRIGTGMIVAIQGGFSVSRRRRLSRRLGTQVLTLLGRNDLGPVLGSHPTWFLDDAAGIPLPNVDTRPLNPATGVTLSIGWDAVEQAEIGVKSALAPSGGTVVNEWLRTGWSAELDPTGLYFLRPQPPSAR
jgi:hypothetical protein